VTEPIRRVRVSHPRTQAAHRARITAAANADAGPDDAILRSLITAQLRLSLTAGAFAVGVLLGVPVLLIAVPQLQDITVARVPLGWLVLAAGVFPAIITSGWVYTRAAERHEQRYRVLVDDA
jgi:hypothetical protein